jgi:hypothetical protein
MSRIVIGAVSALTLVGAGFLAGAPTLNMPRLCRWPAEPQADNTIALPEADPHGRGAALPNAVKKRYRRKIAALTVMTAIGTAQSTAMKCCPPA